MVTACMHLSWHVHVIGIPFRPMSKVLHDFGCASSVQHVQTYTALGHRFGVSCIPSILCGEVLHCLEVQRKRRHAPRSSFWKVGVGRSICRALSLRQRPEKLMEFQASIAQHSNQNNTLSHPPLYTNHPHVFSNRNTLLHSPQCRCPTCPSTSKSTPTKTQNGTTSCAPRASSQRSRPRPPP